MVSYDDVRDYGTSLFIMLSKKTVVLFRIEFLVVVATLLLFAMFLMDFFRRAIHNSFMRAAFSVFDAVSDSIVLYLLGAMQSTPFKNMFPIWALVLVNFRYSADYISGYGVPDRRGRRFTEWRNVFKLLGSAFLNWTRGSSFTGPLWSVWCLQIVRSGYRLFSHSLALRSVWHGESSQLVAEHMRASYSYDDHETSNSQVVKPVPNPLTMKDYNYLVYGETRRRIKLNKPQYALSIDTSAPLITLEKVWKNCPIHQTHIQEEDLKDLPLAFALSRLLRCRIEDVTLHPCISKINRELIKSIIIDGEQMGTSDALKIMELQLAFVHDYFNTRYPMVLWSGHPSLFITLPQAPEDRRQLGDPGSCCMIQVTHETRLEPLEYQSIRPLCLSIRLRVSHGGVIDPSALGITEFTEFIQVKVQPIIRDDAVRDSKPENYFLDELDRSRGV